LPEELEDIEGLDTKDLLSYSFRAVHESRYVCSSRNTTTFTNRFKQPLAPFGGNAQAEERPWRAISPARRV
jgi:hypothetical protein